jgi:hypothetical protein
VPAASAVPPLLADAKVERFPGRAAEADGMPVMTAVTTTATSAAPTPSNKAAR